MSATDTVTQDPIYAEDVQQASNFVVEFFKGKYPDYDLQPTRVLYDMLVRPTAELHAYDQVNLDHYRKASSLQEMVDHPELATTADVDRVLSNFRLTRNLGSTASGNITVIMSSDDVVSVPRAAQFTANGLIFKADETYIATPGALYSTASRKLQPLSDGTFSFTISATAVAAGSAYRMRGDTPFDWISPSGGYLRSYAEGDFTGGDNPETNEQFISRLDSGLATPAMAGRMNIEALIRKEFPGTKAVSVMGFGDIEMLRDSHNMFGIKTGGKADIYVRSSEQLLSRVIVKACLLVDKDTKLLQVFLDRDVYPGFLLVNSIVPADNANYAGSLEIVAEERSVDLSNLSYVAPDVKNIVEGAYTRFQTALIQFKDPTLDVTNMSAGDTKEYKIELSGLPSVGSMQDLVSGRNIRGPTADYIVRAPVPVLVTVSINIDRLQSDQEVDVAAVKTAITTRINQIDWSLGRLPASVIVDSAYTALTGTMTIREPIDMMGVMRLPSGKVKVFRSFESIEIPDVPTEGVSARNCNFFTDATAVSVNTAIVAAKGV